MKRSELHAKFVPKNIYARVYTQRTFLTEDMEKVNWFDGVPLEAEYSKMIQKYHPGGEDDGYYISGLMLVDDIHFDVHLRWGAKNGSGQGGFDSCIMIMNGKRDWKDQSEHEIYGHDYFKDDKHCVRAFQVDPDNKRVVVFLEYGLESKVLKSVLYPQNNGKIYVITIQQQQQ